MAYVTYHMAPCTLDTAAVKPMHMQDSMLVMTNAA